MSNFFKACKIKDIQYQPVSYLTGAIMSLISTLAFSNSKIVRSAFIKYDQTVLSVLDNAQGFSEAAGVCDTHSLNREIISEAVGTGRLWITLDNNFFNIVIDFSSHLQISFMLDARCVKYSDGSVPDDKIDMYLFAAKSVYNTLPSTVISGRYL